MKKYKKTIKSLIILLFISGFFSYYFFQADGEDSIENLKPNAETDNKERLMLSDPEAVDLVFNDEDQIEKKTYTKLVDKGDSLSKILSPWLSPSQLYKISKSSEDVFDLRKIKVGQKYSVNTIDDKFICCEYEINKSQFLKIEADENDFRTSIKTISYDTKISNINGIIKTNLFEAIETEQASLIAIKLANIFSWEVDFIKDIRKGDTFSLLIEKRYYKESFLEYGDIIAAELIINGKKHDAYRFKLDDDRSEYYSSSGKNVNRMFLKSPVAFTRISSKFSLGRYHPILKEYRPHYGVDYAAPIGTPIYAAGDGVIRTVAQNKNSGRYITIKHSSTYQTAYLHMSAFASGIRTGKKINQGELIGYVGQSGLATGPHLCFRMTKNGKPVDPLGLDVPRAYPLPERSKEEFKKLIASLQPGLTAHYAQKADKTKPHS